jgi:hypothetical protein
MNYPTEAEARLALESVRSGRQQVVDEIGMPWWYWWGLATCWVVLGLLSNFDAPWWVVTVATILVGAGHAPCRSECWPASCFVAVLVVLGGPRVMTAIRRDATRRGVVE